MGATAAMTMAAPEATTTTTAAMRETDTTILCTQMPSLYHCLHRLMIIAKKIGGYQEL
jgi:hypothetical protein